jgi:hypothetical protein
MLVLLGVTATFTVLTFIAFEKREIGVDTGPHFRLPSLPLVSSK